MRHLSSLIPKPVLGSRGIKAVTNRGMYIKNTLPLSVPHTQTHTTHLDTSRHTPHTHSDTPRHTRPHTHAWCRATCLLDLVSHISLRMKTVQLWLGVSALHSFIGSEVKLALSCIYLLDILWHGQRTLEKEGSIKKVKLANHNCKMRSRAAGI